MTKPIHTDVKAQEGLDIRYDYVPNERRISKYNREDIAVMKEQLALWGDFPLTKKFVASLGKRANADLIARRKRKRDAAEDNHRASKVAALSDPYVDISPYAACHVPSSPTLADPETRLSATNTVNYSCPPWLADHVPRVSAVNTVDYGFPSAQQPVLDHTESDITQQPLRSQDPDCLEDSTTTFDLAFAEYLKETLISESTVQLFLNLPALSEQTQALKRRFEETLREKEDCLNGDKVQEGSWLRQMYGGEKKKTKKRRAL
jgi:hypothetical protein